MECYQIILINDDTINWVIVNKDNDIEIIR